MMALMAVVPKFAGRDFLNCWQMICRFSHLFISFSERQCFQQKLWLGSAEFAFMNENVTTFGATTRNEMFTHNCIVEISFSFTISAYHPSVVLCHKLIFGDVLRSFQLCLCCWAVGYFADCCVAWHWSKTPCFVGISHLEFSC